MKSLKTITAYIAAAVIAVSSVFAGVTCSALAGALPEGIYDTVFPVTNVFSQNFDGTDAAMNDTLKVYPNADNSFDSALWNHTRTLGNNLGFGGGFVAGRVSYSAGVGNDGSPALSLTRMTGTNTGYLDYKFTDTLGKGVIKLSCDIYMSREDSFYPTLYLNDGMVSIGFNKHNAVYDCWHRYDIYFDLDSKLIYCDDIVQTFEKGYYTGTDPKTPVSLRVNMNPASDTPMLIDNMSIDYYPGEFPHEAHDIKDGVLDGPVYSTKISVIGAKGIEGAFINGERTRTMIDPDKGTVTVDMSEQDSGVKELILITSYADGTVHSHVFDFNYRVAVTNTFDKGRFASAETFDTMNSSYDRLNGEFGVRTFSAYSSISRMKGASGKSGDYAPLMTHNGASNEAAMYFLDNGFTVDNWSELGGRFVMDFDYYYDHNGYECWLTGFGLWNDAHRFITTAGKVDGTETVLSEGEWYHFTLELDRATDKWYVYVDNNLVVNGADRVSYASPGSEIRMRLRASGSVGNPAFGVDNVWIYNTDYTTYTPERESAVYSTSGADASLTAKIPYTAESITITYEDDVYFSSDESVMYINGTPVEFPAMTVSKNTVSIALPELRADYTVKLVLKDGANTDTVDFAVTDTDGRYAKGCVYSFTDSEVKAVAFGSGIDKALTGVLAIYSNDCARLAYVALKEVTPSEEGAVWSCSHSELSDDARVRFMMLDPDIFPRPVTGRSELKSKTYDMGFDTENGKGDSGYVSVQDSEADAKALLQSDAVFMNNCDSYYAGRAKRSYSDWGQSAYISENGVTMVPAELLGEALGIYTDVSGSDVVSKGKTATVGATVVPGHGELAAAPEIKNGTLCVPAASFAKIFWNKYVYEDERGFVLISDKNRKYSNHENILVNLEDIDIIYRYMQFERPAGERIYDDFLKVSGSARPRLFIKQTQIPELKAKVNSDSLIKELSEELIDRCDDYLTADVSQYELPDGLRLFKACDRVKHMLMDLGVAFLLTDDNRYADRMWLEIENCLNWQDWNVANHFLDSGEIGPGIAFAYDVLHDYLTYDQKAFIREKVTQHYLDYAVGVFTGDSIYKAFDGRQTGSNWGAVNSMSMLMCALAFMGDEAENSELMQKCRFIAENAVQSLEYPIGHMFPDGGISEGLGYWDYYVESISWSINALMNMCGSDYGLLSSPGYNKAIDFSLYMQTANGAFNYSGMGTTGAVFAPELYLMAQLYDDPYLMSLAEANRQNLGVTADIACMILWYEPPKDDVDISTYPTAKYFDEQMVAVMRSGWNADDAYLGICGGFASEGGQFDKGSFIYEQNGVRWFTELGKGNQNVEGGYYGRDGWGLYVKRTEGHNSLVINPSASDPGQLWTGSAECIRMEAGSDAELVVFDLSEVYSDKTAYYRRGYYMGDGRQTLTVQDELELITKDSELYYSLHTRGAVSIASDGKSAVITLGGEKLLCEFICDAQYWKLITMPADHMFPENARPSEVSRAGLNKLAITGTASGRVNISVKFTPVDDNIYDTHSLVPIDEWSVTK